MKTIEAMNQWLSQNATKVDGLEPLDLLRTWEERKREESQSIVHVAKQPSVKDVCEAQGVKFRTKFERKRVGDSKFERWYSDVAHSIGVKQ